MFCSGSGTNKHSRGRKTKRSALNLPAALADINIHWPREVEEVLAKHEGIVEAAVIESRTLFPARQ
jgi:hypothetical protein